LTIAGVKPELNMWRVAALSAALSLPAGMVLAQEEQQDWQAIPPMPEKFDWIQLTTDEWLKGELIAMYKDSLEFDSKKFDNVTFDFADVRQIRSAKPLQIGLVGGGVATGKLLIDGEKVLVVGDQTRELERSQVRSIASGEPTERSNWSGKVGAGANLRQGNSDQLETNLTANVKRRTVRNRIELDYLGNYNVTDELTVVDNSRASVGWDWFVADRFFLSPVLAEYFRDPFQNIAHRGTLGVGAGYQLIDSPKVDWQMSAGVAYQRIRFDDVAEGEPDSADTPTILFATVYDHKLSGSVDFNVGYRGFIVNEESGQYTHHFVTGFEFDLIGSLDFDVTFVWDRIQKPRPDSNGDVPLQDDYRLNFALSFDF
jgi:hypothetical protein